MWWPFDLQERKQLADRAAAHVAVRNAALNFELKGNQADASLDKEILSSDISGIVYGIQEKEWTAVQVLCAFIRRAREAQEKTNCLTEVMFEEAIERAKELDRYFEKTGELVGPFHGVPISLKEHFKVKGSKVTLGFSSWLDKPAIDHDGALTVVAKHLGAVPFVKTNIPQTMLAFECNNPLWGRTTNPYNSAYTSGGSLGGEAALLASGGTPISLGSDIGGSLRIPAGYCGLYSLKTTARRWPNEGSVRFAQGFEGVVSVYGPMARTAQDLELVFTQFTKTLHLTGDHSDVQKLGVENVARHSKLREELDSIGFMTQPVDSGWYTPLDVVKKKKKPLRIGYVLADGFVETSPASYRAVMESVEAVKRKYPAEQVELKRLYLPDDLGGVEAMKIMGMTSADGYDRLTEPHLGKDKADGTLTLPLLSARLPKFLRTILCFIAARILKDWMMAIILKAAGRKSTRDYFGWIVKRDEFRESWKRRIWAAEDLDAIIYPVQASPAVPHGAAAKVSMICAATVIFNILEYPVACTPVTLVDATKDSHSKGNSPEFKRWREDEDVHRGSWMISKALYGQGIYDAEKMQGLPVGIQVVTKPFQEEKAIGIMRMIDAALPPPSQRGGVKDMTIISRQR